MSRIIGFLFAEHGRARAVLTGKATALFDAP